jgi:hypothetical protein
VIHSHKRRRTGETSSGTLERRGDTDDEGLAIPVCKTLERRSDMNDGELVKPVCEHLNREVTSNDEELAKPVCGSCTPEPPSSPMSIVTKMCVSCFSLLLTNLKVSESENISKHIYKQSLCKKVSGVVADKSLAYHKF